MTAWAGGGEDPFRPPTEATAVTAPLGLALPWATIALALLLAVGLPNLEPRLPSPAPLLTIPALAFLIAMATSFGSYQTLGGLSVFTTLAEPIMFATLLLLDWRGYATTVTLAEVLIFAWERSHKLRPTMWYVRTFNVAVAVVSGAVALGVLNLAPLLDFVRVPLWSSPVPALISVSAALAWKAVSVWSCAALMTLAARRPIARSLDDVSPRAFFAEAAIFIVAIPFAVAWQVNVWVALLTFASLGVTSRLLGVRELEHRASTDPRTGLVNAVEFEARLDALLSMKSSRPKAFSLIALDIDYFKTINDEYGHLTGDAVIVHLARVLTKGVRAGDIVGRTGGEEFSILLPESDGELTFRLAERMRESIALEAFSAGDLERPLRITASFGVAAFPRDGSTAKAMRVAADAALYAAKAAGRNTVRSAIDAARAP